MFVSAEEVLLKPFLSWQKGCLHKVLKKDIWSTADKSNVSLLNEEQTPINELVSNLIPYDLVVSTLSFSAAE